TRLRKDCSRSSKLPCREHLYLNASARVGEDLVRGFDGALRKRVICRPIDGPPERKLCSVRAEPHRHRRKRSCSRRCERFASQLRHYFFLRNGWSGMPACGQLSTASTFSNCVSVMIRRLSAATATLVYIRPGPGSKTSISLPLRS